MSTSPSSDENEQRLEQIVAYLDGELSSDASAHVEQQLAADEDFRQELQSIDRAWNALDQLPSTVVDDKFLQTTMELVVNSAKREIVEKTQALPVLKRNRRTSKVLLAIAATLIGVLVVRLVGSQQNRQLLADLPVIYQLDVYSQVEQVEYLRMLDKAVKEDWPLIGEELTKQQAQLQLVSDSKTRKQWLKDISDDQRVTLQANFNRFQGLPANEQQRLRTLHQEIESVDDSQQLKQTAIQYQHWLISLPASEQYALQEQPAPQRARQVSHMVVEQQKDEALNLTSSELKHFWDTLKPKLQEVFKKFAEGGWSPRKDRQFKDLSRMPEIFFTRVYEQLKPHILKALPEDARNQFIQLSPGEKREQLHGWIRQANRPPGAALQVDLEEFFLEELDPAEKERLLALPHDQMQQELERRFRGASSSFGRRGSPENGRRPGRFEHGSPPHPPEGIRGGHRGDRGFSGRRPPGEGGRPGPPPPRRSDRSERP